MYADDTTLYSIKEEFASFESDMDGHFEVLNSWFKINNLSLNTEKTKFMVFRKKKHITIHFNNVQITEVVFLNFLGIMFNNKLTCTLRVLNFFVLILSTPTHYLNVFVSFKLPLKVLLIKKITLIYVR